MTLIESDDLVNLPDAAAIRRTSLSAIYELVKRKRIPSVLIGKHLYVTKTDLAAYVPAKPGRKPKR